jgi:dihydrodipicolinate synthase/N-acetylneuraminate lyase
MSVSPERRAQLARIYTAMVLPQTAEFEIDEPGVRRLVRYFVDDPRFAKVGGIVVNPEAGENYYLTREEKRRVLDITLEEVNGKMPVFAGTFGWTTRDVIDVARDAKAAGADGIFVAPPAGCLDITYCWDPVKYPEVWLNQIKEQVAAVDLPIICHPVAASSAQWGIGLPMEAVLKICAEVPNVVGWKMTYSYNGHRILSRALREHAPQVAILNATASMFHENLATGYFDGSVSGSWNVAMETMLDHIEAWRQNDIEGARKIWYSGLSQLQEWIYSDRNRQHIRYKLGCYTRGLLEHPEMRPPMLPPSAEEIATGAALVERLHVPNYAKATAR